MKREPRRFRFESPPAWLLRSAFRVRTLLVLLVACNWGLAPSTFAAPPLVGEPFPISVELLHQIAPAVAHNPQRRNFLVVWQSGVGGGGPAGVGAGVISGGAILARTVSADSATTGPTIFVGDGTNPDVAFNEAADQFLVVWSATTGTEIRGVRINGDGEEASEPFTISGTRPDSELRPAVAFNNHGQYRDYLVVWEDGHDDILGVTTRW